MLSTYIIYIVVALIILLGIKRSEKKEEEFLLSKMDTQVIKGVAACFVISAHYMSFLDLLVGGSTNKLVKVLIGQLGGIGVVVFFFVSGYGIYTSYADKPPTWNFLWKRIKTIYIPYVIIKIIIEAIYILGQRTGITLVRIRDILTVEDWFIKVILIQYFIFFILWKRFSTKWIVVLSFVLDILLSLIFIIEGKPERWFNSLWLFTFGMVCSKYKERICQVFYKKRFFKISLLVLAFMGTGAIFVFYKGSMWANVVKPLSGLLLCLAMCEIMRSIELNSKVMLWAGERSFYLYIVHLNVWDFTNKIESPVLRFWIALIVTIIVTEIVYRFSNILLKKIEEKLMFNKSIH